MKNAWFTYKQIVPNIWGIAEFNHFEKVISYLIIGKRQALLFDTGMGIKSIKEVVNKLTKLPISVLNSHAHYDHVGGNKEFKMIITSRYQTSVLPFRFSIIHTPGHSPDSICLYEKKLGYIFSGDTIYSGPIYLHLKESKLSDYKKSINKLIKINSIKKIFPGHNDFKCSTKVINLINEKLKNIDHRNKKIQVNRKISLLIK